MTKKDSTNDRFDDRLFHFYNDSSRLAQLYLY